MGAQSLSAGATNGGLPNPHPPAPRETGQKPGGERKARQPGPPSHQPESDDVAVPATPEGRTGHSPGEAGLGWGVGQAVAELGDDPIDFCVQVGF